MDYLSFLLCLLLAWVALHLFLSATKKGSESNQLRVPPGPSPLPIFGNLFSLGSKPHISLTELAKTYGPLMTLRLGRVPTVVISSAAVAKEALQKNDVYFSNRAIPDAIRALNHHQRSVVWLPAGSQWRNIRKICNSLLFSVSRLEASQSVRRNKVEELLFYVQKCSKDGIAVDIRQAAFTTTLNLLSITFFSVDLGDPTSKLTHQLRKIVEGIVEEAGKPNFADYFPFLRKMDPQGIRRRTGMHFQKMIDLFNSMIDQRLQGKKPSDSVQENDVLDALLGLLNQEKTKEFEAVDLLLDLFVGGTHTTSSTLEWAMAEILHSPEKLKKAQAELEDVIGKGNPIEEPHIARLPYLQAVIKETLRLHPAVPFLVPRKVESDVKLFGFLVPKDTQVLVNVWAIGRDPDLWEDPYSFQPERFLGSEIDLKGHDPQLIPFGTGRRICLGLPLAIRMLHLMLGSLIHEFDWKLDGSTLPENTDMEEKFGIALEKAHPLHAIPVHI